MLEQISVWLPLLAVIVTAMGGAIAYAFQKKADRRHQLIEMRRAAYRDYIIAFMNQISPGNGVETLSALQKKEMDLFLVASDDVLRAVGAFSQYGIDTSGPRISERNIQHYKTLLVTSLLEMRRDCFEASSLSRDEALSLLPME